MSLPPGQCCISGTSFNSACNASASHGPAAPCGTPTNPTACYKYEPCRCTNDISLPPYSAAYSADPYPSRPSMTWADYQCCIWAKEGAFTASDGCLATTSDWASVCEYGGASMGNFANCQLSCKNNGHTSEGWSPTCAASPSPPPPVPPPPSPPSPPSSPLYLPPPASEPSAQIAGGQSDRRTVLPAQIDINSNMRPSMQRQMPVGRSQFGFRAIFVSRPHHMCMREPTSGSTLLLGGRVFEDLC